MVTFNIIYFLIFLSVWFTCGIITLLFSGILLGLRKEHISFSPIEFITIIACGSVGLIFTIFDILVHFFNSLFGVPKWVLIGLIGSVPFKYNETHNLDGIVPYNPLYAKQSIDGKFKIIEATFPKNHPSYFKLKFQKRRSK